MTLTIRLPKLHDAQRRIERDARRYNVVSCGRRFGKTTLGMNLAIVPALTGKPVGWFAPTYKYLSEAWRELERVVRPIVKRSNASERRIELITRGVLEFWTLEDTNAGRGRKYGRVIIDEAGMVEHLGDAWETAIRPTLADLQGDAWLLGTPKGRNFFHDCFERGIDPEQPDWMAWQMSSHANPFIKPEEIEAMKQELPERRYLQEVEAQFLEDAGGVFRNVRSQATAEAAHERTFLHQYVIGADWGRSDFSVFIVLDATTREMIAMDRSHQVDYAIQVSRLKALCDTWKPSVVVAEKNSMGEPIIEQLVRLGIPVMPFVTGNASKAQIIDDLALAFEQRTIRILNNPILISELEAYEQKRTSVLGLRQFGAPDRKHDDTVMALALAWYGISYGAWNKEALKALSSGRPL